MDNHGNFQQWPPWGPWQQGPYAQQAPFGPWGYQAPWGGRPAPGPGNPTPQPEEQPTSGGETPEAGKPREEYGGPYGMPGHPFGASPGFGAPWFHNVNPFWAWSHGTYGQPGWNWSFGNPWFGSTGWEGGAYPHTQMYPYGHYGSWSRWHPWNWGRSHYGPGQRPYRFGYGHAQGYGPYEHAWPRTYGQPWPFAFSQMGQASPWFQPWAWGRGTSPWGFEYLPMTGFESSVAA